MYVFFVVPVYNFGIGTVCWLYVIHRTVILP